MKTVIDVTAIEPRLKHPTIFEAFDKTTGQDLLTILNDHDPKPLYYQLLGERGNIFTWNYVQNGPEVWQVEIQKRAVNSETLGEMAASDIRKADVFKRFGLDFCCGGKQTLEEACHEKGIDTFAVKEELNKAMSANMESDRDYNAWTLSFLCDYIVQVHHNYIRKTNPVLLELSEKVATRHGNGHPELYELRQVVSMLVAELNPHMLKEEHVLFPYIKALEGGQKQHNGMTSIEKPVWMMEMDHQMAGNLVADIRMLTNEYALPDDACQSYRLLFQKLEEYDNDLKLHIHLENNILFPKAMEMDKKRS
jgi:regulator of cell morphogenesis and NO signaling